MKKEIVEFNGDFEVNSKLELESNISSLDKEIDNLIEKLDVVVQPEDVASTKKIMANINKTIKAINESSKEQLGGITDKISAFKAEVKKRTDRLTEFRKTLKDRVDSAEQEQYDNIKGLLLEYREIACKNAGIDPSLVDIADQIKLWSVTKSGVLTSAATTEIDNKVAVIENQILKDKLEEIKADEEFNKKVDEAVKAKIANSTTAGTTARTEEIVNVVEAPVDDVVSTFSHVVPDRSMAGTAGTKKVKVTAEFILEVDKFMLKRKVHQGFSEKLKNFKSLSKLSVVDLAE